jgi:hypothetical protein
MLTLNPYPSTSYIDFFQVLMVLGTVLMKMVTVKVITVS